MRVTPGRGPLARRVVILASGAGVAQLVPILASPVLTRVYSPAEYGTLALFGALATVLVTIAAGRYHTAIMLPKQDEDATHVTTLALSITVGFSALVATVVGIGHGWLTNLDAFEKLGYWLFALPPVVLLSGTYNVLTYLSMRHDRYGDVTKSNVLKAVTAASTQICLGVAGVGVAGLLAGNLLSVAAANGRLYATYRRAVQKSRTDWNRIRILAKKYSAFPNYDLWSSLANSLSYNATVVGLSYLYSAGTVGHYALAYRLLAMPSALVGTAVGQVYLRHAAQLDSTRSRAAVRFYDRTALKLAMASLVPFVLLMLFSSELFVTIFGPGWSEAGKFTAILVPLVWVRFVTSPLTHCFLIYGRQRSLLVWQIAILAVTGVTFAGAYALDWPARDLLAGQSIALAIVYALMLVAGRSLTRRASGTVQPGSDPV